MAKATSADQSPKASTRKTYDIKYGSWEAKEQITNPFDGKTIVLKWEFKSTKTLKTNVTTDDEKVIEFNDSRKLRSPHINTEQMIESDSTEPHYDILPNPFESVKL